MRILVADDDRVISHLVCTLLRGQGHQVTAVFDAMQVVMFAMRAPQPEVIVLDINMPAGNGIEALKKLKMSSRTASIPVLVLSGTDDPSNKTEAVAQGAVEFLSKPVDPETLLEAVARVRNPAGR